MAPKSTAADILDPHADPFAWDPNPLVVVSRRRRVLHVPEALLRGAVDEATQRAWVDPRAREERGVPERRDRQLALSAGVTFLGTRTSSWALLHVPVGNAPQGAPPERDMLTLWPFTSASDLLAGARSGNLDRDRQALVPGRLRDAMLRCLEFSRIDRGEHDPDLWTAQDGFDAPELQLITLKDLFDQRGEAGQHAHATTALAIPHLRRHPVETVTPLGALHDYALRHRSGLGIATACRAWAARKKVG